MNKRIRITLAVVGFLGLAVTTQAQTLRPYIGTITPQVQQPRGFTVIQPGSQPQYGYPNGMGGYTVTQPGAQPQYIYPNGGGGYTIIQPGSQPRYIYPQ